MIAAHSWGENVARNFLAWVDQQEEGWVERHVAVYMNIAGSTLGVPKVCRSLPSPRMHACTLAHAQHVITFNYDV